MACGVLNHSQLLPFYAPLFRLDGGLYPDGHTGLDTSPTGLPCRIAFFWHNRKSLTKILALVFDLSRSVLISTCLGLASLHIHKGSTNALASNLYQKSTLKTKVKAPVFFTVPFISGIIYWIVSLHYWEKKKKKKGKQVRGSFLWFGGCFFFQAKVHLHSSITDADLAWSSHKALGQQVLADSCLQGTGTLQVFLPLFCCYLKISD